MRFDQLQIPAFGPFTDFSLTFESNSNDLHLIYGANERGKSSLLRAIDHLLFGIPPRSTDNFLHAHQKLRIGATISESEEERLFFQRKKGNANTLLDADGNVLPDTLLKAFLGPVDSGFFSSMFGLDTESLRDGAGALIAGEGELGSALFSASLGSTDIDAAIAKLQEGADGLFKGRSTKVRIPVAMKAFKECEKASREATTKVTAWKTLQKALKAAQEEFDRVDEVQRKSQQRLRAVERLLSALPIISQLAHARKGLEELAYLPELADDFVERVKQAREQVRECEQSVAVRENQLGGLREQLAAVKTQPEILKRSEKIEHLYQALDAHLSRKRAMPPLRAEHEAKSTQLGQALEKLGLTMVDLTSAPKVTTDLVEKAEGLKDGLAEAASKVTLAKATMARVSKESAALVEELSVVSAPESSTVLKALRERARSAETARSRKTELTAELKKLSRANETLAARLSLADLAVDKVQQLAPPSTETIHEEKARLDGLEKRIERVGDERSDLDRRIHDEETALATLREQGARHTEDDLAKKRRERDEHLTAALEGEAASRKVLPREVREADEVADSLRSHAEQIARAENHARAIADLNGKRELASSTLGKLSAECDQWQEEWESRCAAIPAPVQPPHDLIGWVTDWRELREVLDRMAEVEDEVEVLAQEVGGAHEALAEALVHSDAEFGSLVALLEERLASLAEATGAHQERVKRQAQLKRESADAEEAIEKAEAERERQQAVLGELTARFPAPIDGLQRLQDLASAVEELEQRITQEENAIQDMDARLVAVRPEASQENHATEVGQLWAELETAKSAESQAKVLQASIDAAEEKRSHDKAALESASAAVTELREICGAAHMGALETTLAEIERKSECRKGIAKAESNLASMSGGQSLERFIEEATGSSEDELQGEKAELERVLPEHQGARDTAREQLNVLKAEDAQLQQASDAAAVQQQQAELHLSSIVSDVRRFMELQHAIQFLREQIEIYRERTQGPMIESTSTYFAALTNGGFAKVAAQMTEKNVPKLVGVREDGSFIETTAMSEGTADQLYLALRFAAIDLHLSTYSPMPLVLDDLLMTFDDERTTALLPILANLSQKTQILVFTHHQHLLDLFERNLSGQFVSHRL
ncbi:MAG: AAA family ATPase [Verrucomicrobiaceae bacterium]|nr:AAA family ATPase [Verrucomicrobiaceae bacterium]